MAFGSEVGRRAVLRDQGVDIRRRADADPAGVFLVLEDGRVPVSDVGAVAGWQSGRAGGGTGRGSGGIEAELGPVRPRRMGGRQQLFGRQDDVTSLPVFSNLKAVAHSFQTAHFWGFHQCESTAVTYDDIRLVVA